MLGSSLRWIVRSVGLTGVARRVLLWLSGDERRIAVDGTEATFVQRDFGDYIELNQVGPESAVIADARSSVRPDDVFLDVGSNLGAFAVFVGDRIETGRVLAVEPVPATSEKLRTNLERNDVSGTVHSVAFSDDPGTFRMTVPDAHGSSSLSADGGGPTVEAVTGDRFLREQGYSTPTIVKVDVEGHELAALRGLEATLSDPSCRLVYCEVHADRAGDPARDDVEKLLSSLGFEVETFTELPGDRRILRAQKRGADV